MKIGYFVQGLADEAFIIGIVTKYCPDAIFEKGVFRGSSHTSLKRELRKGLLDLDSKYCDYFIVLTDSDNEVWQTIYNNEKKKIPAELYHKTIFGVADRNIECWLAIDKHALASELGCNINEIPNDDPSGFVKRKFGINLRDEMKEEGKQKIINFVLKVEFFNWINNSDSFKHFWDQIYQKSKFHPSCEIPNEAERPK